MEVLAYEEVHVLYDKNRRENNFNFQSSITNHCIFLISNFDCKTIIKCMYFYRGRR